MSRFSIYISISSMQYVRSMHVHVLFRAPGPHSIWTESISNSVTNTAELESQSAKAAPTYRLIIVIASTALAIK